MPGLQIRLQVALAQWPTHHVVPPCMDTVAARAAVYLCMTKWGYEEKACYPLTLRCADVACKCSESHTVSHHSACMQHAGRRMRGCHTRCRLLLPSLLAPMHSQIMYMPAPARKSRMQYSPTSPELQTGVAGKQHDQQDRRAACAAGSSHSLRKEQQERHGNSLWARTHVGAACAGAGPRAAVQERDPGADSRTLGQR